MSIFVHNLPKIPIFLHLFQLRNSTNPIVTGFSKYSMTASIPASYTNGKLSTKMDILCSIPWNEKISC